ncbi:MAG: hypothetical protein IJ846_01265 [Alphaproteobacteria bacterium]|nr:hypothetical protein [Alphaproteobacteria bacterium]
MAFTFGKLAKNIIKLSSVSVDAAQKAAFYVAANFIDNPHTKKSLQKVSDQISSTIENVSVPVSDLAESTIDGTIVAAGNATGLAAKKVCEFCDASPEVVETAEKYGKFVGKAAVGFAIGNIAAAGVVSSLSATGTAGAAATTSGLAALGGGMQAGITAANAITAATTLCAALTSEDKDNNKLPAAERLQAIEDHSKEEK